MATRRWNGGAAAVTQKDTITVANTWATNDTGTITVNSRDLVLTVGAAATTADVAAAIAAAINAGSKTDGVIGTETRNVGGQEIPEFQDFTAEVSGSTVILTAAIAGTPHTVTVSESTAGTGTLAIAATIAATGPNHFDNADNWSGNTLPVDGDTIQFDSGDVDVLYGLTHLRTGTKAVHFIRTTDYTGEIGLPAYNSVGGYPEYRSRYLQLYDAAGAKDVSFVAGANGGGGGITRLDGASQTLNSLTVLDAGNVDTSQPSVEYAGGTLDALVVRRGYVAIDMENAPNPATTISAMTVGAPSLQDNDTLVVLGDATLFSASTAVVIASGTVISDASFTHGTPITVNQTGGTVELRGANFNTYNVKGGTFIWSGSGTFATYTLAVWTGATLDLSTDSRAKTFGTLNAYGNSTLRMGGYTTATITYVGCSPEQVNVSYYAN